MLKKIIIYSIIPFSFSCFLTINYDGGDFIDYKNYFHKLYGYDIFTGYILYFNTLGATEPFYYLLNFLFCNVGFNYYHFVLFFNFLFILTFLINIKEFSFYTYIVATSYLIGFHAAMLYVELERLKVAFVFFFLGLNNKSKFLSSSLLLISVFCHYSIIIIFFGKLLQKMFLTYSGKVYLKYKYIGYFAILLFIPIIFYDKFFIKVDHYISSFKTIIFFEALITLLYIIICYPKSFFGFLIFSLPILSLSPFFEGGRILILWTPTIFLLSTIKTTYYSRLLFFPFIIYFLYRGINFACLTYQNGRGITL